MSTLDRFTVRWPGLGRKVGHCEFALETYISQMISLLHNDDGLNKFFLPSSPTAMMFYLPNYRHMAAKDANYGLESLKL